MACSKVYCRCAPPKKTISWWNQLHPRRHFHRPSEGSTGGGPPNGSYRSYNPVNFGRKCRDTLLLVEASSGLGVKVALGLGQAGVAAALVFGTGYGAAYLMSAHTRGDLLDGSPQSQGHPGLMSSDPYGLVTPKSPLLDEDSIIRYVEERNRFTNRRINLTYFHLSSSLVTAGLAAILSFRLFNNKSFLVQVAHRPMVAVGVGIVTPFLLGSLVRNLPRTPNQEGKLIPFGTKEVGHLMYAGTLGLIAAPLYLLGGHGMIRAACVTAGSVVGLQGVAKLLPTGTLANLETPLMIAINAVLVSFLLTLVLPQHHFAFVPLYRFMMHGGLPIYAANYIYCLHKMETSARSRLYDPVNAAMSLSMSILNIYGRLAFLLPPYFNLSRDHFVQIPHYLLPPRANFPLSSALGKPHQNPEPPHPSGNPGGGTSTPNGRGKGDGTEI